MLVQSLWEANLEIPLKFARVYHILIVSEMLDRSLAGDFLYREMSFDILSIAAEANPIP